MQIQAQKMCFLLWISKKETHLLTTLFKNLTSDSFTINLYRPLQTISFESPKQGLHISLVKSVAVLLRMVMPFHSTYVQGVLLISFKTVYLRYGPPKIFSSTI